VMTLLVSERKRREQARSVGSVVEKFAVVFVFKNTRGI
jgi:hypothetical protein